MNPPPRSPLPNQVHEATRMKFRVAKMEDGAHHDVIVDLGSLELRGSCFSDCQRTVREDLVIAKRALENHQALVGALEAACQYVDPYSPVGRQVRHALQSARGSDG